MRVPALLLAALAALTGAGCPVERGLDCSEDVACPEELLCEPRGDGTSVCVPPEGVPRLLREPCRPPEAPCGGGLVCFDVDGVDGPAVATCSLEDGALCFERDEGPSECKSGGCVERICNQLPPCDEGGACACTRDDDCAPADRCAGTLCGATCATAGARGEACVLRAFDGCGDAAFTKGCADGLVCAVRLDEPSDGVCLPPGERAAGELCNRADECASGACVDRACT